jgi:hypothetical protein|eukprot:COSAG02_NODE_28565_length_587_cov_0.932377_1_plen_42_part_00
MFTRSHLTVPRLRYRSDLQWDSMEEQLDALWVEAEEERQTP